MPFYAFPDINPPSSHLITPRSAQLPADDVFSFGVVFLELFPQYYGGPRDVMVSVGHILMSSIAPWEKRFNSYQLLDALQDLYELTMSLQNKPAKPLLPQPQMRSSQFEEKDQLSGILEEAT